MNSRARALILTARPKTLAAAVVPVVVASALARYSGQGFAWWISLAALGSAVFIQIGTNFINDAIDFIKGADTETRLGDARAAQSGWFSPKSVMAMGLGCLAMALVLGIPLVYQGGVPILIIGLVSLVLGYAYTGGPFPLAYVGLGDPFVILFFGLIAVGGVYFLQTQSVSLAAGVAGLQIGLLATVLIAINNLRDLEQDRLIHKKTLAVRLGPKRGRLEIPVLFAGAFALNIFWLSRGAWWAGGLPNLALIPAYKIARTIWSSPPSREYNGLLAKAAMVHMLFGALFSLGLSLQ